MSNTSTQYAPVTVQSVLDDSRLSVKELAALTGLPSETLRAWKSGRRKSPTDDGLVHLADGLEKQGGTMLVLAGTVRGMVGRKRTRKKRKKT